MKPRITEHILIFIYTIAFNNVIINESYCNFNKIFIGFNIILTHSLCNLYYNTELKRFHTINQTNKNQLNKTKNIIT